MALKSKLLGVVILMLMTGGCLNAAEIGPAVDLANGKVIYFTVCQACHGDDGQGGAGGGAPLTDALTVNQIMNVLKYGQNTMPEFGSVYTKQELRDVATFVMEELVK